MMERLGQAWVRMAVCALVVLALSAVAFAHRPIAVGTPQPVDMAAYVLPDGSVPVICAEMGDMPAGLPHAATERCDACLLTTTPGLPPSMPTSLAINDSASVVLGFQGDADEHLLSIFRANARGPPLLRA